MTREELIALAREARLCGDPKDLVQADIEQIERFAALVAAREREECAKLAENEWSNVAERMYGQELAAAIRARGNQ